MKINITKAIAIIVFAPTLIFTSSCSKPKSDSQAAKKVSLRLAWVYDMAEVGIFVAKDHGFYDQEGLDLEIKPGGFGLDPFKLVAAKSDTFGVGGAVNLLLAREKGLPIVAVAAEFQETPVGFVSRKNSGIANFPDFKNRKIGVQTGADTDTIYRALLNRFSMTSKDVQEVPIQFDPTPFVTKQIDVLPAYVTNQPITLKNQGIDTNVITAKSQGMTLYGNVYFTTQDTLGNDPELVAKFLRATRKGWDLALSSPKDAIASIKVRSKDFSDADLQKIHAAVVPFIRPSEPGIRVLGMAPDKWKLTHDALRASGLSTTSFDASGTFKVVDGLQ